MAGPDTHVFSSGGEAPQARALSSRAERGICTPLQRRIPSRVTAKMGRSDNFEIRLASVDDAMLLARIGRAAVRADFRRGERSRRHGSLPARRVSVAETDRRQPADPMRTTWIAEDLQDVRPSATQWCNVWLDGGNGVVGVRPAEVQRIYSDQAVAWPRRWRRAR